MRKALAVVLIGGSLAVSAATAFAEERGGRSDIIQRATSVTISPATDNVQPVARTWAVEHEGKN